MQPVIVLVGRPNVGKSTLFNALTRSRDALVADMPGLTRDRQYGPGRLGSRPYIVVDTGGLAGASDNALTDLSAIQTRQALAEADAVVFLVDGRAGLASGDRAIADELRKLGRAITVAVNKSEGVEANVAAAEFHALGLGAPIAISAAHGQGVTALIETALAPFPPDAPVPESNEAEVPRIAIAGRPNVGKSTLVNALLGEERVLVFDRPGTTRDSIRIPFTRDGREYILIDTAGVRRRHRIDDPLEKISVVKTLQAIDDANIVILVLDATQEVSEQDANLAGYILEQGRSLVLAINKWDGIDATARAWIKREVERKLPFLAFSKPHFISALQRQHIDSLFPAVDRAYASARRTLATPILNRVLARATEVTPPPVVRGHRIKLKFAHQGGQNPPLIVVHGNLVDEVPDSYRRYLANAFAKAFKLEGTPVRIDFKVSANPYKDKRNKLTPRQAAKRRRLVRHIAKAKRS